MGKGALGKAPMENTAVSVLLGAERLCWRDKGDPTKEAAHPAWELVDQPQKGAREVPGWKGDEG